MFFMFMYSSIKVTLYEMQLCSSFRESIKPKDVVPDEGVIPCTAHMIK